MITGTDKNPSFGLAADGKPENVPNGHLHVEIDTFKTSLYDEENNTWYEDAGGGGGGGGSGLPDYSEASEGDVLSIDSNGDPAWAPPSSGGGVSLPPYTAADAYKVLGVDENGELTWFDIGNGGGVLEG